MRTPLHAVPATQPRALGYIRVSRERDDMTSPEIQERAIRDHCARNGYDLVDVLPDLDLSGRFWKRRKVEQAIARVEAGDVDVIVVWKISRVARDPRRLDWNIAVDRVESVGGRLESATEPFDTSTSSGRFSRGVLAELAAFESERMGEMWNETHQRRWGNGLPHSGRPRFGYLNDKHHYWPNPETAPIVREMYERFIAGDTYRAIMLWLQPMQLGTMTTHKSVSDFMDSGFATGWITHHDPACPIPHRDGNKGCKNRIRTEGAHEPIVNRETFEQYESARRARAFVPPRLKAPQTAFAGIIYCTTCGWRYVHHSRKDGGKQYRCGNTRHCPQPGTIARSRIEAAILDWLPEVAGGVNAEANAVRPDTLGDTSRRVERERLERIVIDTDKALVQLTKDYARRIIPEAAFTVARDELTAERDAAAARATQLIETKATSAARLKLAADLLDAWPEMLDPERNRLLKELAVIHVTPIKGAPKIRIFKRWEAPELERIPKRDTSK